jgi:hypothetical protein
MKQPLSIRSRLHHLARAAGAGALLAWAAPGFAAPDWDILGLKLGMTEAEVRAALQAYDPNGKIGVHQAAFQYSDKINSFSTPAFLSRLELRTTQTSGQVVLPKTFVRVWFSGPTSEARAIAILREESNVANAPSGEQFLQTLASKYGQPTVADRNRTPIWEEQGKPSCLWIAYGSSLPKEINHTLFSSNLIHKTDFSESVAALERRQQGSSGEIGIDLPPDLAACGAFLYYLGTTNSPARSFTGAMFDVGAIVATQRARNAWVQQMEDEAVKKREGKAEAPRL